MTSIFVANFLKTIINKTKFREFQIGVEIPRNGDSQSKRRKEEREKC